MKKLSAIFLVGTFFYNNIAMAAEISTQAVQVAGTDAVLIRPAKPKASIILLTGGNGRISISQDGSIGQGGGNQLVRTRNEYAARGFAVLVPNSGYNLSQAIDYMRSIKQPVTVVGTSRGTQRAAKGIADGAQPDKLVLTSGFLSNESGDTDNVMNTLGSSQNLPKTLVLHHKNDGCKKTLPAGVEPFMAWAKGKANLKWLSGGHDEGDPCQAQSHHGFLGLDSQVVSAVSAFAGK